MRSSPITIREAEASDIPFLQAMHWEAAFATPTLLAHYGPEGAQQHIADYWGKWAEHPDPAFVAIDATGRKVGAAMLRPNETEEPVRSWLLFAIAVEANARSQGVGRCLIERVIAFAKTTEAEYVNLLVDPTNPRALALYQRLGFVEIGEKDQVIEMRLHIR